MSTVFLAGSISIRQLHEKMQARIASVVSRDHNIVVGDAEGADTAIQHCLKRLHARKVTVYCSGTSPRNNLDGWPLHPVATAARPYSREYFTAKDLEMASHSDYGLMVWDCQSTGTLGNIFELLKRRSPTVVFLNQQQEFYTVTDEDGLKGLLNLMEKGARMKAESKMGLALKMKGLRQEELQLTR